MDTKPLLVIPSSTEIAAMLDVERLVAAPRAQKTGVVVIAPRRWRPADLMIAAHTWPAPLARAGVTRLAVLLGVESYVTARPLLRGCAYKLAEHAIDAAFFHEGHLESDEIRAFFEARRPRRRVTSDALIKLSHRYALRGDARSAASARRLAEATAGRGTEQRVAA
jgi:hypothetical protein